MNQAKAQSLADQIRKFWKVRGYAVETKVFKEPFVDGFAARSYGVRTNLKNGLPPGYRGTERELLP